MIYFNAFERWGFVDHTKQPKTSLVGSGDMLLLTIDHNHYEWMHFVGFRDKYGKYIYGGDLLFSCNNKGLTI